MSDPIFETTKALSNDLFGWEVGTFQYDQHSTSYPAARNSETGVICFLVPLHDGNTLTSVYPRCYPRPRGRNSKPVEYDKLESLPQGVKINLWIKASSLGSEKFTGMVHKLLQLPEPFSTPKDITFDKRNWAVFPRCHAFHDGRITCAVIAFDRDTKTLFKLYLHIQDGQIVTKDFQSGDTRSLDELPSPVRTAMADITREIAFRFALTLPKDSMGFDVCDAISGDDPPSTQLIKERQDMAADPAKRPKYNSLAFIPPCFSEPARDAAGQETGWVVESSAVSNRELKILELQIVASNLGIDESGEIGKSFSIRASGMDENRRITDIVIEQLSPSSRTISPEEFVEALPSGVRRTMVSNYEKMADIAHITLPAEQKVALTRPSIMEEMADEQSLTGVMGRWTDEVRADDLLEETLRDWRGQVENEQDREHGPDEGQSL